MSTKIKRNNRKKTDIPVPEPRHRVGPRGVSSGISFRNLPPPSLDQIKKICEHYQEKCAGTYKSLASRYVYQMATEIEGLVESLKLEGHGSEVSIPSSEEHAYVSNDENGDIYEGEYRGKPPRGRGSSRNGSDSSNEYFISRRNTNSREERAHRLPYNDKSPSQKSNHSRNSTPHGRRSEELYYDHVERNNHESSRRHRPSTKNDDREYYESSQRRRPFASNGDRKYHYSKDQRSNNAHPISQRNLKDQNKEVLRWLKEEMERSQELLLRSNHLHDAELDDAKQELQKVKKAAKMIIKAVHKKGKDKAAKSEAHAESERKSRERSQRMVEDLIQSHSAQIDLLKKGIRHSRCEERSPKDGAFYPWGELRSDKASMWDNPREVCSLMDDSDLTSVLDGLAEDAYQQSCCSVQS